MILPLSTKKLWIKSCMKEFKLSLTTKTKAVSMYKRPPKKAFGPDLYELAHFGPQKLKITPKIGQNL